MWITDLGHGLESCLFPGGLPLMRTQPQTQSPSPRTGHHMVVPLAGDPVICARCYQETEQQARGGAWGC